ncbi:MAG: YIP1 family protein [Candidatus Eiseniibacteriota bacterium]|nr:MAG: YIP1 family protein [Candidatus Eisenbacteria bacterium]
MSDLTGTGLREEGTGGMGESLGRAIRVLFSPTEVFQTLDKRPGWLAPLLICVLVTAISSWIIFTPVTIPEQREQMEKRFEQQGMTEEQLERATQFFDSKIMFFLAVLSPVVLIPLAVLVVAAVLHFVCALILGGQSTFSRTFSVMAHAAMVILPGAIVKVPLQLIKKTTQVHAGLGLLVSSPEPGAGFGQRFSYNFLAQVDVFNVWEVILLAIGLSVIFKFSRPKSYYTVGVLWVIWLLGSSAVGALMQR